MNTILDKFGIYDLVAVLLSGISISTFSILILRGIYKVTIDIGFQVNETLTFFVLSYFLGLIFQEAGSFLQNIIMDDKILKKALDISNRLPIRLTEHEKKEVYSYVIEKLNLDSDEDNDKNVYNYCKYCVSQNENILLDKEQSLGAMSRSLFLYFIVVAVAVIITTFFRPDIVKIILSIIILFFAVLFYYRWIRLIERRYIYIIRTFYYDIVKSR